MPLIDLPQCPFLLQPTAPTKAKTGRSAAKLILSSHLFVRQYWSQIITNKKLVKFP